MNPKVINDFMQRVESRLYRVKAGEEFRIALPNIPMTSDTEFVQLVTEEKGDDCASENPEVDTGEGTLQPRAITGMAKKSGKKRYTIRAMDALSQKEIDGVEPVNIDLEVTE